MRRTNIEIFHADVQPIKPTGYGGLRYYLINVNDKHRIPEVEFLHDKGQAADRLISFCKKFKNITGRYPTRYRIDSGSEFKRFITWAKRKGIDVEPTPPRSPEPNGVAERYSDYLNQTARAMILDAKLPAKLWPYAIDNLTLRRTQSRESLTLERPNHLLKDIVKTLDLPIQRRHQNIFKYGEPDVTSISQGRTVSKPRKWAPEL
jgi:hypothetical protein